ncbi:hypothetical protein CAEBREN_14117 [Caenorhabditis brenneri]|uniref:BTB domain-containing protein n=1 Tax=Caenorhabditis brenneri TaxID=135651 RepID=G0P312_CAEBE|nr:hypothetical protein CAEBREN_14117 [Caenorhabditis brenneri]
MPAPKSFLLKHTFKNVSDLKEDDAMYSDEVVHFGVPWGVRIKKVGEYLAIALDCYKSMSAEKWSSEFELKFTLIAGSETTSRQFELKLSNRPEINGSSGICEKFIDWNEMVKKFVIDGFLTVEIHVWGLKLEGFERKPLRSFDKSTKQLSDTTLIVRGGEKFYVSKLHLASESSHFKSLLMGDDSENLPPLTASSLTQRLVNKTLHAKTQFMDQFKQPGRKVVTLEDVDPAEFQVFLEAIYGEPAINDDTINQILKTARLYNADTVIRRCEEFLIEKSAKRAGLKFDIALKFGLESLKKHCITNFKSTKDVLAAIPSDLSRIDRPLLEELLTMNLSFQEP